MLIAPVGLFELCKNCVWMAEWGGWEQRENWVQGRSDHPDESTPFKDRERPAFEFRWVAKILGSGQKSWTRLGITEDPSFTELFPGSQWLARVYLG